MNLERLLAENMVRFKTRNLTEHQVKRILKEDLQLSSVRDTKLINPVIEDFVKSPAKWPEPFATAANGTLAFLRNNKISFTNVSLEKAAAVITLVNDGLNGGTDRVKKMNKSKDLNDFLKQLSEANVEDAVNNLPVTTIQLNESPTQKGMVLTNGYIRPNGISAADPGAASSIDDIVTFCNNYNIAEMIQELNGVRNREIINIVPYKNKEGTIVGGSFIQGDPKTTPGAGSLDLTNSQAWAVAPALYSKDKYTAASGQTTGTQNITVVEEPGPAIPVELDKDSFPILEITLSQKGIDAIKAAVELAKTKGQIQNVKIESAASFDEKVNKTNAEFAKAVGLQPNQVPADPTKDAEGVVKDPMYGGNSFLAYMRGQAIAKQLAALGVQSTPPVAIVKTGKDASRYAKLSFEVKKPDGEITFTSDELKSIGRGSTTDSGAGRFQIFKFGID